MIISKPDVVLIILTSDWSQRSKVKCQSSQMKVFKQFVSGRCPERLLSDNSSFLPPAPSTIIS